MTEENKKPQEPFRMDDDVDVLLGILHNHKDSPAKAAPSQPSSVRPQPNETQGAPANSSGQVSTPSTKNSAPTSGTHAAYEKRAENFAKTVNPIPEVHTSGTAVPPAYSSIPQSSPTASDASNGKNGASPSHSAHSSASHTKTTSRPKVVDFDDVDPTNARLRHAKRLKKNAATGKSAVIGLFKTLLYLVCVVGVSIFLAVNIIHVGNDIFAFVKDDIRTTVTVPEGASLDEVAHLLKENGIIRYPWVFKLYAKGKIDDSTYYTGEFNSGDIRFVFVNEKINQSDTDVDQNESVYSDYVADSSGQDKARLPMSYDRILSLVAQTDYKERDTVRITIPEGYTVDEILDLLIANGVGERDKYIDAIQNYDYNYRFVTELSKNTDTDGRQYRLEGYLFPDTYDFFTDESEISVINKLLSNFDVKMESVYYDRADELGMSVDEVIILASIIEKEAVHASDLSLMASVFHNRLKKGMRLDSDATVMYALPERKTSLIKQDLEIDSPYNTYKRTGLTPGAISNPGIEAINAAFYPDSTNYYYFFSLKSGDTVYSTTYDQHSSRLNNAIAEGTLAS